MENKIWKIALYARLSREDGDKVESDSIANQKDLMYQYIKSFSDVEITLEYADDGFSGVNFDRPSFQNMIKDIKENKINCVIVKDLSRFGRNWIESGKYIDKIFPFMGVRFISILDNIDTINEKTENDSLIIPFKNLMNESYPRQTSISVRSHLETKRKKGDYVGSFCVYGYKKDRDNHNKLVIDEVAAATVRNIFDLKIKGYSNQRIANHLNEHEVLSPLRYKLENNINLQTPFQINRKTYWTSVAISRVLTNEIYIGVLEQGKVTTPNFKVKKRISKQKNEWIRIENSHEPIVSELDFKLANGIIKIDTRISPNENSLYLFSGILKCADCNQSMIRKTIPSKDKKYIYYICSENKNNKTCSSHSISDKKLENTILISLQNHVKMVLSMEHIVELINEIPYKQEESKKTNKKLEVKENELNKIKSKRFMLYDDYKQEIISKEEYIIYKESYDNEYSVLSCDIELLKRQLGEIISKQKDKSNWLNEYKKIATIEKLTRKIIVTLIEKIYVYENGRIDIQFRYRYHFETAMAYSKKFLGEVQ